MGKASSAKKVARAAGIGGGRTRRIQTPATYLAVLVAIVGLGVVGTWTSRDHLLSNISAQGNVAPTVGTVWDEAYAVYECGKLQPPVAAKYIRDPQGITTAASGDGVGIIEIDPTTKAAAGKNATLGKFASAVGMKLNAAELQLPGGKLWVDGDKCEGAPGHVYVMQFPFVGATTGTLLHQNPPDIRLADDVMITIAFVPSSQKDKIPPPPANVQDNLKKLVAAASSSTTTTPTT
jgi:hypothetical protein